MAETENYVRLTVEQAMAMCGLRPKTRRDRYRMCLPALRTHSPAQGGGDWQGAEC